MHPFLLEFPQLLEAVRLFAGSATDPFHLHRFRDFVRTLKSERIIRGELWSAVARVQVNGIPHSASRFRLACLFAMAGASDKYAVGTEQQLLGGE